MFVYGTFVPVYEYKGCQKCSFFTSFELIFSPKFYGCSSKFLSCYPNENDIPAQQKDVDQ